MIGIDSIKDSPNSKVSPINENLQHDELQLNGQEDQSMGMQLSTTEKLQQPKLPEFTPDKTSNRSSIRQDKEALLSRSGSSIHQSKSHNKIGERTPEKMPETNDVSPKSNTMTAKENKPGTAQGENEESENLRNLFMKGTTLIDRPEHSTKKMSSHSNSGSSSESSYFDSLVEDDPYEENAEVLRGDRKKTVVESSFP